MILSQIQKRFSHNSCHRSSCPILEQTHSCPIPFEHVQCSSHADQYCFLPSPMLATFPLDPRLKLRIAIPKLPMEHTSPATTGDSQVSKFHDRFRFPMRPYKLHVYNVQTTVLLEELNAFPAGAPTEESSLIEMDFDASRFSQLT